MDLREMSVAWLGCTVGLFLLLFFGKACSERNFEDSQRRMLTFNACVQSGRSPAECSQALFYVK